LTLTPNAFALAWAFLTFVCGIYYIAVKIK
jgi:hypothetical protein